MNIDSQKRGRAGRTRRLIFLRDESGQSLIIFALTITLLLGFLAVVVNIGLYSYKKQMLQNAADAAALAGAQELPQTLAASAAALSIAMKNGVGEDEVKIEVPYNGDSSLIEVTCESGPDYVLKNILGFNQKTISASALAQKSSDSCFDYGVFSSSMNIQGSNSKIYGNIHVNGDFSISSANITITGDVMCSGNVNISGSNISVKGLCQGKKVVVGYGLDVPNRLEKAADVQEMPDISPPLRSAAVAAGSYYSSSVTLNSWENTFYLTPNSPVYIDGNLTINGQLIVNGQGIIYATGSISVSNDVILNGEGASLMLYASSSASNAINLTGGIITKNSTSTSPHCILYAPNGGHNLPALNPSIPITGAIIGNRVVLNSGISIISDPGQAVENGAVVKGTVKLIQ